MDEKLPVLLVLLADGGGGLARDRLDLNAERDAIEEAFREVTGRRELALVVEVEATVDRYARHAARFRDRIIGLHFAGHAIQTGIVLQAGRAEGGGLGVEGFAATLGELPALRWVFLNGCDTAPQVETLHRCCPVPVVATHGAIRDDFAIHFAHRFYEAFAHGSPMSSAFRQAEGLVRGVVADPTESGPTDEAAIVRFLRPAEAPDERWPWLLALPDGDDGSNVLSSMLWPSKSMRSSTAQESSAHFPTSAGPIADGDNDPLTLEQQLARAITFHERLLKSRQPQRYITGAEQRVVALKRAVRSGRSPDQEMILAGRWLLIRRLGRGGFAQVWKAWDSERLEEVAVKILHGHFMSSTDRRSRFLRGARQMARFEHAHIVPIVEPEVATDGFCFFVMGYKSGGDLADAVENRRLIVPDALECIRQVAEALSATHAVGIVHRDVKPRNIVLDDNGQAYLTDFDLVCVRNGDTTGLTGAAGLGTGLFVAPEIMSDASAATPASDIYSLGMSALFVLLGRQVTLDDIRDLSATLQTIDAPPAVKLEVMRAIASKPVDRHPSAAAFAEGLRVAIEQARRPLPSWMAQWQRESAPDAMDEETLRLHTVDDSDRVYEVSTNTLIGRGLRDGISFDARTDHCLTVSRLHALIAWVVSGRQWAVQDLGSASGTQVDGRPIATGQEVFLTPGSILEFGKVRLRVSGFAPPLPSARHLESGEQVEGTRNLLLLPNSWAPEIVVLRRAERWFWERTSGGEQRPEPLDQLINEMSAGGMSWRVWLPQESRDDIIRRTSTVWLRDVRLVVETAADLETFNVQMEFGDGQILRLAPRRHHELLWILVSARLDDQRQGLEQSRRGWLDRTEVARRLGLPHDSRAADVWVYRLRSQVVAAGLPDGKQIIQRDKVRGIRVGISRLVLREMGRPGLE